MRTPLCLPLKLQFAISIAYFSRTSWTGDGFAEDCVLQHQVYSGIVPAAWTIVQIQRLAFPALMVEIRTTAIV